MRAEVVAMACALPAEQDVPLSRWTCPEIVRELAVRARVAVSASSVRRWLAADALKPWQHRSWISIRDPGFEVKAARVLDLYAGRWKGRRLGPNDFVICSDEKTPSRPAAAAIPPCHQAKRGRCAWSMSTNARVRWPTWPPGTSTAARSSAAAKTPPGSAPFARLVTQVMTSQLYASADRVFWIVDNGPSHRGQASIDRMTQAWPTAHPRHRQPPPAYGGA